MKHVDYLMKQAVSEGVFPGAVLLVSQSNVVSFHEAYGFTDGSARFPMTPNTVFDLASLTKPLATTLATMKLVGEGCLDVDNTLASLLPQFENTGKGLVTIRHLLSHNSGLPDYRPYYKELAEFPLESREEILRKLLQELPLLQSVGTRTVYSDLGFMILRWVVEVLSGKRLDQLVVGDIYRLLAVSDLFYIDRRSLPPERRYAATERCPWRRKIIEGEVHDENAWILGGVEGHAGLFGTAAGVNTLLGKMLTVYYDGVPNLFLSRELLQRFFTRQDDSDRALGFDVPSPVNSSCGQLFSERTIGHLGFTGTSFWIDLDRSISVILLTNRVHPTRENIKIRSFRPLLHDAVMETAVSRSGTR